MKTAQLGMHKESINLFVFVSVIRKAALIWTCVTPRNVTSTSHSIFYMATVVV